jgi:hypothetical protein
VTPPASTSPLSSTTPARNTPETQLNTDAARIDVGNAELLLHFVSWTADTLAGENFEMQRFWRHNAPHIGLSHPYVLHFILALAALHLAGGERGSENQVNHTRLFPARLQRSQYLSLAHKHVSPGLSGFSSELSHAGPDNCGALYLGATLTSYSTFASGPTSPNDLLVCTADGKDASVEGTTSSPQIPFVYGVRLLSESFTADQLFAGPLEAFQLGSPPQSSLEKPISGSDGFSPLAWEEPLDGLRQFIAGSASTEESLRLTTACPQGVEPAYDRALCLGALDDLIDIYTATYGRRDTAGDRTHNVSSEKQFVFGWLYRIDRQFVSCVRRREPLALLVLAHFAVLLNRQVVRDGWYVEGWREHIITRAADMIVDRKYQHWMQWPTEQILHGKEEG